MSKQIKFTSDGTIRTFLNCYKAAVKMKGYMPENPRYDQAIEKYSALLDEYLEKAGITVNEAAIKLPEIAVNATHADDFAALYEWAYIRLQNSKA